MKFTKKGFKGKKWKIIAVPLLDWKNQIKTSKKKFDSYTHAYRHGIGKWGSGTYQAHGGWQIVQVNGKYDKNKPWEN